MVQIPFVLVMPFLNSMKTVRRDVFLYTIVIAILFFFLGFKACTYSNKKPVVKHKQKIETIATVMIDAGHGGYDGGTINVDGTYEKDLTLQLALELGKQFKKVNPAIRVVYTRTNDEVSWPEDEVLDLQTRVDMAKEKKADYFISIHINSNEDSTCYGYSSYIRANDASSMKISNLLAKNLDKINWQYDRGTQTTDDFPLQVIDDLDIPAILFEAGFGSNLSELQDLEKPKNQKCMGKAIAQAYNTFILQQKRDQNN